MLSSRSHTQQPETGKRVGEYLFSYADMVGRGNFARVYRGVHLPTGQTVAIKAISLDALKSQRLEALVFEEIRVLQMMDHPNVLRLREALLSERNCYIVTELCPHGNLQERIRRGPMSDAEIAAIFLQLVEGLRYLRSVGVVHRDFKTANIFLSGNVAKIADFGLAKFYKERFHDIDVGSPHYMSPQGLLLNVYSEKTDVWALGAILFEMAHGRNPYAHLLRENQLKYWIVRPLPQNTFRKDLHPVFKALIMKLLEVDEIRRPSINDIAKDPLIDCLREMASKKEKDSGEKRKFSFHQGMPTLFHKKPEVGMHSAVLAPPTANKSLQNKSVQVRSNQCLLQKPLQPIPKALFVPSQEKHPVVTNTQSLSTLNPFMSGSKGSIKTNQTNQDSQPQGVKLSARRTDRSFWG